VHCGSGFWRGQRPSPAHYVTGMGPMDGATAAGGRSCCLSSWCREVAFVPFVLIRPVRWSIDGGSLSGLACRSPGPARSPREEDADVHCGIGSCGVPRPSLAPYVAGTGAARG
jgi:hypothetical protein